MAYFERIDTSTFRATEHVGGAWVEEEQHIAAALGLLVHAVEQDRDARRDDHLVVARMSYDILGTVPVDVVDITMEVLRPGRTIELVEAVLSHAGRAVVRLRAWLMQTRDTTALAGTALPRIKPPEEMEPVDPTRDWPGGFIRSIEVRRDHHEPGHGAFWARTAHALVAGEESSRTAAFAGMLDVSNGMAIRADPREVLFPNLDLTAHFFAQPQGEWVGYDTTVSFGAAGIGLTHTIIHDRTGPIGAHSQVLTVRPR